MRRQFITTNDTWERIRGRIQTETLLRIHGLRIDRADPQAEGESLLLLMFDRTSERYTVGQMVAVEEKRIDQERADLGEPPALAS